MTLRLIAGATILLALAGHVAAQETRAVRAAFAPM